jgi:glucose-1-phosphate thymidylyltransferase
MRGILLAGGEGTRLGKNRPYNKQLSLVYDRLMLEYPIETLRKLGASMVTIVSSPEGVCDIFKTYRDEINEMPVDYAFQYHPNGAADALRKAKTTDEAVFPVLCGDVYFDPAPEPSEVPTLYWHDFPGGENHSVWDPETNTIVEKPSPEQNLGRRAIVAYYYDQRVFDVIDTIEPSERGELELVDLHRWYLENGAEMKEYKGFFADMGTPDGILRVANHIKAVNTPPPRLGRRASGTRMV